MYYSDTTDWTGTNFAIASSSDLVTWTLKATISSKSSTITPINTWAPVSSRYPVYYRSFFDPPVIGILQRSQDRQIEHCRLTLNWKLRTFPSIRLHRLRLHIDDLDGTSSHEWYLQRRLGLHRHIPRLLQVRCHINHIHPSHLT